MQEIRQLGIPKAREFVEAGNHEWIDNLNKFDVFKIIPLSSVPSGTKTFSIVTGYLTKRTKASTPGHESAECVLAGTRRSKALTTTELMHMPPCLHGRRLNSSFLLPASIDCSSKRLIASQRTSRPISRIPCMYIHWKDWYRILAKIWTKHGSWTKHLMDGPHPAGHSSIRYLCGCTITVFAQLATLAPSWCWIDEICQGMPVAKSVSICTVTTALDPPTIKLYRIRLW